MRWLALVFPLLLNLACGKATDVDLDALESPSNRSIVVTSDYPAVVMVVMPGGHGLCTGTFISPTTVATAAHCTQDDGSYLIVSSFGNFRTSTRRNFGPGVVDDPEDLALLILDESVANPRRGQVIAVGQQPDLAEKVRLVGFGCNDFEQRLGTGVKRTGTNQVSRLGDYVELYTPRVAKTTLTSGRALIGSDNRSGTCFGDSGGPLLNYRNGEWGVAAISHAGASLTDGYLSGFVNLNRGTNLDFLKSADAELDLGIFDVCRTSARPGISCSVEFASAQIEKFLRLLGKWLNLW